MERYRILCIDDEPRVLDGLRRHLERQYEVLVADTPEKAFDILRRKRIDLVICDHKMPQMTGVELLGRVKDEYPETLRFLLTGYADLDVAVAAINEGGVHRFITKPCNNEELKLIIRDALEGYRLRLENRALMEKIAGSYRELQRRNEQLREQNEVITKLNEELRRAKAELQEKVKQIDTLLFEAERRSPRASARI